MKRYFLFACLSAMVLLLHGQRKWTGAVDGSWQNALNWQPAGIPAISDEVVIDNSMYTSNYVVTLPATTVTIASLLISPSAGKEIRLVLPVANVTSPALVITNAADALVINSGGIFQNASGLTGGQSLRITGSIRINNGGTYIHNTRSAHATDIVARLSVAEGTEEGIFEFDIPSASSTISLSNRSFGKLKLSANAYNANVSYSGGGSNPVTIRSDLEIGDRVNFSVGFSNVFTIRRNLVQRGGSFNISNDNNATVVAVGGNILQLAGQITETGVTTPVLLLNGPARQDLQLAGGVLNEIIVRIDNPAGVELKSPLNIQYRLDLRSGKLKSSPATLLTLQSGASVEADSLSGSFIDGPLRKEGLNRQSRFLFPVGKAANQRWVELHNATGNFTITYKQQNPYDFSMVMDQGLDHVSSLETWTIDVDPIPNASAHVELSFDNLHSGGVSDLATLRVAGWQPGVKWCNQGNTAVTGSAGASGSVVSQFITDFSTEKRLFTLGSSNSNHNALPAKPITLNAKREGNAIRFEWQVAADLQATGFIVEGAAPGGPYHMVKAMFAHPPTRTYSFILSDDHDDVFFRIKVQLKEGGPVYSKVVNVERRRAAFAIDPVSLPGNQVQINLRAFQNEQVRIHLCDVSGRMLFSNNLLVVNGDNRFVLPVRLPGKGWYFVTGISKLETKTVRFFKR